MDYNEVAVFIKVVQLGSFVKAGLKLGMPKSTVSNKVAMLEQHLGITLIQRTTRKLSVTPAGEAFFIKCVNGIEQINSAEAEAMSSKGEPQGLLRVTAPVELGSNVLPEILAQYSSKYPKASIELVMTDRRVDLLNENIDVAIRGGPLKDSSMIAKRIGTGFFVLIAAPKYFKTMTMPKHPKDLIRHKCIQFTPLGVEHWALSNNKVDYKTPVAGKVIANDLNIVKALAIKGEGIALLPIENCRSEIRNGKLIQVLPEWRSYPTMLHFLYPSQKYVTSKLSAFIELASEILSKKFDDLEF